MLNKKEGMFEKTNAQLVKGTKKTTSKKASKGMKKGGYKK